MIVLLLPGRPSLLLLPTPFMLHFPSPSLLLLLLPPLLLLLDLLQHVLQCLLPHRLHHHVLPPYPLLMLPLLLLMMMILPLLLWLLLPPLQLLLWLWLLPSSCRFLISRPVPRREALSQCSSQLLDDGCMAVELGRLDRGELVHVVCYVLRGWPVAQQHAHHVLVASTGGGGGGQGFSRYGMYVLRSATGLVAKLGGGQKTGCQSCQFVLVERTAARLAASHHAPIPAPCGRQAHALQKGATGHRSIASTRTALRPNPHGPP